MKTRIALGKKSVAQMQKDAGLDTVYQSGGLLVQGDGNARILREGERVAGIIVGNVVGLQSDSGAQTRADEEAVARLMGERDLDDCMDRLEGRFILIKPGMDGTCEISGDRYGRMDLYYFEEDGGIVFATDLGLLPKESLKGGYDQAAIAHTLCIYGNRPPKKHTIYSDVKRLGVRETAHWDGSCITFREAPFLPLGVGDYGEEALQDYSRVLLDAVEICSSPDQNIVYLSSGWDSTSLLACLVKIHGSRKVRGVIGRMQYAERSGVINQFELDRARAVADYFGVELDVVEFDYWRRGPEDLERLKPILHSNQIYHLTVLNQETLARYAGENSTGAAVFAGEISDGAHNLGFSQFTTIFHPVLEFREYSDKMASYLFGPTFLEQLLGDTFREDAIYRFLCSRVEGGIFDEPSPKASARAGQLLASFFLRPFRLPLWSLRNVKMMTEEGRELYSSTMEKAYLAEASAAVTPETLYAWYLHLYNTFHWQGSTVTTLGLSADMHGFDIRLPFWNSRLQDFLSGMPESWGRGLELKPTKYPLKWMLERAIDYPMHLQVGPHSYLYDVDPSFSHSREIVYGSAFTPYFKDIIRTRPYHALLSPEVFELHYIDRLVDGYLNGEEATGQDLSDLLTVSMLCATGW